MASSADLTTRYGSSRRIWPFFAVVGIAAAVAWAAWVALQPRPVNAVVWGYKVLDDHHIRVVVDVYRPKPTAVQCTVYAQAMDHAVVGERTVDVAGSPPKIRIKPVITTERRAVTGVLRGCRPHP